MQLAKNVPMQGLILYLSRLTTLLPLTNCVINEVKKQLRLAFFFSAIMTNKTVPLHEERF